MGRNLAGMSIWKVLVMMVREYEFEKVDAGGEIENGELGMGMGMGKANGVETVSYGMTELKGGLLVNVKRRGRRNTGTASYETEVHVEQAT
jgi:hypothetical protein